MFVKMLERVLPCPKFVSASTTSDNFWFRSRNKRKQFLRFVKHWRVDNDNDDDDDDDDDVNDDDVDSHRSGRDHFQAKR